MAGPRRPSPRSGVPTREPPGPMDARGPERPLAPRSRYARAPPGPKPCRAGVRACPPRWSTVRCDAHGPPVSRRAPAAAHPDPGTGCRAPACVREPPAHPGARVVRIGPAPASPARSPTGPTAGDRRSDPAPAGPGRERADPRPAQRGGGDRRRHRRTEGSADGGTARSRLPRRACRTRPAPTGPGPGRPGAAPPPVGPFPPLTRAVTAPARSRPDARTAVDRAGLGMSS